MSERKNSVMLLGFVLSVSLICVLVTAVLMSGYYGRTQFELVGTVCRTIAEQDPEAEKTVLEVLKSLKSRPEGIAEMEIWQAEAAGAEYLSSYGYRQTDFLRLTQKNRILLTAAGFLSGGLLFLAAFWYRHRRDTLRLKTLTEYLERVNTGGPGLQLTTTNDDFSRLQDEIYKTVTFSCQTRDAALEARQNFAENLSNIAHQLKTPITAMSLSAQMISSQPGNGQLAKEYAAQIKRQLKRLTHLEEALLLLSRLDSGTLPLERMEIDVFTVLTLAADNLGEVFKNAGVSVDIPEMGEIRMTADLEWTMEAIMNLLKNCMEHTPAGGTVHCAYEQNPLYTQILIWDEGEGFASEDIPRLFERFYRGKRAKGGGIGIGLSIAKAILENENGTVSAKNLPDGGACFEVRIYASH